MCHVVEREFPQRVDVRKLYLRNGTAIGTWPPRLTRATLWRKDAVPWTEMGFAKNNDNSENSMEAGDDFCRD